MAGVVKSPMVTAETTALGPGAGCDAFVQPPPAIAAIKDTTSAQQGRANPKYAVMCGDFDTAWCGTDATAHARGLETLTKGIRSRMSWQSLCRPEVQGLLLLSPYQKHLRLLQRPTDALLALFRQE